MDARLLVLVAILALPMAFAMATPPLPLQSTGWTVSNYLIDSGQYQTLTSNTGGGTLPINFNVAVYNSMGHQVYSSGQPDIIVQYSNGLILDFNATPENQWSVGSSLAAVVANAVNGESIYLKAGIYNITSATLDPGSGNDGTVTGVNLYGAGKYATTIVGNSSNLLLAETNSTTSDLTLKCNPTMSQSLYCIPWAAYTSVSNVTLRNVYLNGLTDGIFVSGGATTGVNVYNITITSEWDTLIFSPSTSDSQFNIFDSSISSIANPKTGDQYYAHGITVSTGTMDIINTSISASNGLYANYGVYAFVGGKANIFGGLISTTGADLDNYRSTIAINATTSYTTKSGTISNTLGTYGSYNYRSYPMAYPSPNAYAYLQQASFGTGIFTANVLLLDNSYPLKSSAVNSLTYIVNPELAIGEINSMGPYPNSFLNGSWEGGTPPYSLTWYSGSSTACASDTNIITSYNGLATSYNVLNVSTLKSTYYCIEVTDSASTPLTDYSATYLVNATTTTTTSVTTSSSSTIFPDRRGGQSTGGLPPQTTSATTLSTTASTTVAATTAPTTTTIASTPTSTTTARPQIVAQTQTTAVPAPLPPASANGLAELIGAILKFLKGLFAGL